jgi:hypothetical protein
MANTATKTRHWTDYQVGQQVYCVLTREKNRVLTVRSVGRKYVRFEGMRDEYVAERVKTDIIFQGFGQIGTLYESEAAYEEDCKLSMLKTEIARLSYHYWFNLPPKRIKAIAEILEIEA